VKLCSRIAPYKPVRFIALILIWTTSVCWAELPTRLQNSLMKPFRTELKTELDRRAEELGLGTNGLARLSLHEAELARRAAEAKLLALQATLEAEGIPPNFEPTRQSDRDKAKSRIDSLANKLAEAKDSLAQFLAEETVRLPPKEDPNRALLEAIAELKNQKASEVADRDAKIEALKEKLTVKNKNKAIRLATLEHRLPKLEGERSEAIAHSERLNLQHSHREANDVFERASADVRKYSKKATLPPPGSSEEARFEQLLTFRAQQDEKIKQEEKRLVTELSLVPPQSIEEIRATADEVARLMKERDRILSTEGHEGIDEVEKALAKAYERMELQIARSQPKVMDYLKSLTSESIKYAVSSFGGMILLGALGVASRENIPTILEMLYQAKGLILSSAAPYVYALVSRYMETGNKLDLIPFRQTYLKLKAKYDSVKKKIVDKAQESSSHLVRAEMAAVVPAELAATVAKVRGKVCVDVSMSLAN